MEQHMHLVNITYKSRKEINVCCSALHCFSYAMSYQVGAFESSKSAMKTDAPQFMALMTIFRSTGPVISTRLSCRSFGKGATCTSSMLRMRTAVYICNTSTMSFLAEHCLADDYIGYANNSAVHKQVDGCYLPTAFPDILGFRQEVWLLACIKSASHMPLSAI